MKELSTSTLPDFRVKDTKYRIQTWELPVCQTDYGELSVVVANQKESQTLQLTLKNIPKYSRYPFMYCTEMIHIVTEGVHETKVSGSYTVMDYRPGMDQFIMSLSLSQKPLLGIYGRMCFQKESLGPIYKEYSVIDQEGSTNLPLIVANNRGGPEESPQLRLYLRYLRAAKIITDKAVNWAKEPQFAHIFTFRK